MVTCLCPPMEKQKVGTEVVVCIPVGSVRLRELIWPCAVSISPWDYGICVYMGLCVCDCGCCHGNPIKQLAVHVLFQVSVCQTSAGRSLIGDIKSHFIPLVFSQRTITFYSGCTQM